LEKSGLGILRTGLQLANFENMKFMATIEMAVPRVAKFSREFRTPKSGAQASKLMSVSEKLTGVVSSILIVPINPIYYDLLLLVEGVEPTKLKTNGWLVAAFPILSHPFSAEENTSCSLHLFSEVTRACLATHTAEQSPSKVFDYHHPDLPRS